MRTCLWLVSLVGLLAAPPLAAQEGNSLPEPQRAETTASDGLLLVGDFYAIPGAEGEMPAVLLLHGITSNRHEWTHFIGPLLDNGFNVLAVDQRAHGETGGDRDLVAAIGDVPVWLAWLREQPSVQDSSISTIGSSWGTVPALAGCAADPACVTAIVLSPGDFPLLDEAMFDALRGRSVLFVVGRKDNAYYDTHKLFDRASGEAALYVFDTGAHGSTFLSPRSAYRTTVINLILGWLNDHLQRAHAAA